MPVKPAVKPLFISPADLAGRWGTTRQSMKNLIGTGRIPHFRIALTIRIPLSFVYKTEAEAGMPLPPDDSGPEQAMMNRTDLARRWAVHLPKLREWVDQGLIESNTADTALPRIAIEHVRDIETNDPNPKQQEQK
jgi:hypothetical protein